MTKLSPQDGASALTPRSQSPTSSISSARSGSSVEYLLDRSGAFTPHLDLTVPDQRLSHYDNNCHPWSGSPSNCDKNTTHGLISQTVTQEISADETTLKSVQRIKQSITSVHSSTYDSGIYDNKDFNSLYSAKSVNDQPPPLPDKHKRPSVESSASVCIPGQRQRVPSMYDNVAEELAAKADLTMANASNTMVTKTQTVSSTDASGQIQKQFVQNVERTQAAAAMRAKDTMNVVVGGHHFITNSSTVSQTMQFTYLKETFTSEDKDIYDTPDGEPPPLPPKKRHVETYMQIFGNSPGLTDQELTRRSVRSMHFYHEQWQQHQMELFMPSYRRSNTFSVKPTENQSRRELCSAISSTFSDSQRASDVSSVISGSSSEDGSSLLGPILATSPPHPESTPDPLQHVPELPIKQRSSDTSSSSGMSSRRSDPIIPSTVLDEITEDTQLIKGTSAKTPAASENKNVDESETQSQNVMTKRKQTGNIDADSAYSEIMDNNILDEVDVSKYLVRKKEKEDGPDLRGGCIDALIVHATTTGKNDFMYQEAFLTTYRTMITSHDLVEKLIYRYNRFSRMNDIKKKKLSRNAFSLLTRVVNELCTEVDETLIEMLMALVFQMLCDGELTLARVLRAKVLEKCHYLQKRREANQQAALWPQYKLSTRQYTMFHFKSQDIAEQMTLLDAELFQKIEIPEVLLWAKEQVEEHSPNLTKFTEHFNKMSYWCRTRIMEQEDPKDREHCFVKFIKIMRYLEKFNNFNSYLAILSALSSSPLARLDWQKQNVDTLAQYFLLIDNTHGFRTYRQRLSETEPPCIPYIGLILQDLTFVHVGNKDWLSDNVVNFIKRWQQFNILDNMRRFRKCNYEFTKKEKIISFFSNFDNYLPEETLWQISEAIKPPKRTLYR
ncbi:hypothetical protein LSH36_168g00066 [Paralvinella palmiformis]|uniref:CRK SH3-binding GNRP n=1 Tax=Paralvinella palmiformis TaxID=53620 RepID=A0AAD9JSP6_9ANNE|nr:hypothetical protein LSH36_168g00066 [Paralvinella palmiformis]